MNYDKYDNDDHDEEYEEDEQGEDFDHAQPQHKNVNIDFLKRTDEGIN
jgi:hypothetical protein